MARLEAAEMSFPRSVKAYTRLDKIRNEGIRKELNISAIQALRSKHKQSWINHLERMDNTRLPKHALNYKLRGRRYRGRHRKRWQRVKRPNPWRKKRMMIIIKGYIFMTIYISNLKYLIISAYNIPSAVCVALPEDEQVMLETCRGP
jgi:hypothetical protein